MIVFLQALWLLRGGVGGSGAVGWLGRVARLLGLGGGAPGWGWGWARGRSVAESEGEELASAEYDEERGVVFYPPVYAQRYAALSDLLRDPRWAGRINKIVDLGYHDISFIKYLKEVPGIHTILGVDIEMSPLHCSKDLFSYEDYVSTREDPLKVVLFQGNAADPDYRLIGCDAVVAIEMIEHMLPHDLERLIHTVFGFIKPWVAIFTTPNADFNVLFKSMEPNGLRRWDHHFEWTREQFNDWCSNIVLRYPQYTVSSKGIGPGPADTAHLGCCSQLAIFVAKDYKKQMDLTPDSLALITKYHTAPQSSHFLLTDLEGGDNNLAQPDVGYDFNLDTPSLPNLDRQNQSCLTIFIKTSQDFTSNLEEITFIDKPAQCNIEIESAKGYLMVNDEETGLKILRPHRKTNTKIYEIEDVNCRLNCSTVQVRRFSERSSMLMANTKLDTLVHTREVIGELRHLTEMLNLNRRSQLSLRGQTTWNNICWGDNAPYWNQYYNTVKEYEYPFESKSTEQRILDLMSDEIHRIIDIQDDDGLSFELGRLEIPLERLMPVVKHLTDDIDKVKDVLEWNGYEIVDNVVIHSRIVSDEGSSRGSRQDAVDWPDTSTDADWDCNEMQSITVSEVTSVSPDMHGKSSSQDKLRCALDRKLRKLRTMVTDDADITSELENVVNKLMKLALCHVAKRHDDAKRDGRWMRYKFYDLLSLSEKAIRRREKHGVRIKNLPITSSTTSTHHDTIQSLLQDTDKTRTESDTFNESIPSSPTHWFNRTLPRIEDRSEEELLHKMDTKQPKRLARKSPSFTDVSQTSDDTEDAREYYKCLKAQQHTSISSVYMQKSRSGGAVQISVEDENQRAIDRRLFDDSEEVLDSEEAVPEGTADSSMINTSEEHRRRLRKRIRFSPRKVYRKYHMLPSSPALSPSEANRRKPTRKSAKIIVKGQNSLLTKCNKQMKQSSRIPKELPEHKPRSVKFTNAMHCYQYALSSVQRRQKKFKKRHSKKQTMPIPEAYPPAVVGSFESDARSNMTEVLGKCPRCLETGAWTEEQLRASPASGGRDTCVVGRDEPLQEVESEVEDYRLGLTCTPVDYLPAYGRMAYADDYCQPSTSKGIRHTTANVQCDTESFANTFFSCVTPALSPNFDEDSCKMSNITTSTQCYYCENVCTIEKPTCKEIGVSICQSVSVIANDIQPQLACGGVHLHSYKDRDRKRTEDIVFHGHWQQQPEVAVITISNSNLLSIASRKVAKVLVRRATLPGRQSSVVKRSSNVTRKQHAQITATRPSAARLDNNENKAVLSEVLSSCKGSKSPAKITINRNIIPKSAVSPITNTENNRTLGYRVASALKTLKTSNDNINKNSPTKILQNVQPFITNDIIYKEEKLENYPDFAVHNKEVTTTSEFNTYLNNTETQCRNLEIFKVTDNWKPQNMDTNCDTNNITLVETAMFVNTSFSSVNSSPNIIETQPIEVINNSLMKPDATEKEHIINDSMSKNKLCEKSSSSCSSPNSFVTVKTRPNTATIRKHALVEIQATPQKFMTSTPKLKKYTKRIYNELNKKDKKASGKENQSDATVNANTNDNNSSLESESSANSIVKDVPNKHESALDKVEPKPSKAQVRAPMTPSDTNVNTRPSTIIEAIANIERQPSANVNTPKKSAEIGDITKLNSDETYFEKSLNTNTSEVHNLFDRKEKMTDQTNPSPLAMQTFSGFSMNNEVPVGDQSTLRPLPDSSDAYGVAPDPGRQTASEEVFISNRTSDSLMSSITDEDAVVPDWLFRLMNNHREDMEGEAESPATDSLAEALGEAAGAGAGDGRGVHDISQRTTEDSSLLSTDSSQMGAGADLFNLDAIVTAVEQESSSSAREQETTDRSDSGSTAVASAPRLVDEEQEGAWEARSGRCLELGKVESNVSGADADVSSLDTDAPDNN